MTHPAQILNGLRGGAMTLLLCVVTMLSASSIVRAQQPSGGPVVVKCGYNSSPPTITSGSTGVAQCDSTGHLITSGTISVGAVTVADGADTAEGTTTDTAWISGAGTTIAILKKIAGNTAGGGGGGPATLASGAVASGAYSAGALTVGAAVDGWNITAGAKADAAWVSGSGSVIALLKTIAGRTTQAISAVSLPLPTNAATGPNQTSGSQKTQIVDGSGTVLTFTGTNANVQCANCSGTGASATDGATFTAGSSVFAPSGGIYQTTATSNPLTNGKQGLAQLTANRAVFTNLRDSSGNEEGLAGQPLRTFDTTVNTSLAALAVPVPLTVVVAPYAYTPVAGAQYNTAIASSTALTVPATATIAKICVQTAAATYTTDGSTTPTSTVGIPIDVGGVGCITLSGATVLTNFRIISATGKLNVEYFN